MAAYKIIRMLAGRGRVQDVRNHGPDGALRQIKSGASYPERIEERVLRDKPGNIEGQPFEGNGWEIGIRTPTSRVRVCRPTIRRSPSISE